MIVVKPAPSIFRTRSFRIGLGLVGLAYAGIFAWLGMQHQLVPVATLTKQKVAVAWGGNASLHDAPPTQSAATIITPEIASAKKDSDSIALPAAPIDGLYEDTADGRLPKIRSNDNVTAFAAYRRSHTSSVPARPAIAIGIVGYGLSDTASKAALSDLSPDVSVVLTPYTKIAEYWIREARSRGHEVWMELPVETETYPRDDSGPQTLLIGAIEKQNIKKLNWVLSQAQGYVGVVTPYQASFFKSVTDATPVLDEIYGRGLGLVEGANDPSIAAGKQADAANAPYSKTDVWIDIPSTPEHMAAALRQLEVTAQQRGSSAGFISSTPAGLKMLQTWIDGLSQKGIDLIPLSAQAQKAK